MYMYNGINLDFYFQYRYKTGDVAVLKGKRNLLQFCITILAMAMTSCTVSLFEGGRSTKNFFGSAFLRYFREILEKVREMWHECPSFLSYK